VAQQPAVLRRVVAAFREAAGDDKPVYLQVHVSWAPSEDEASAIAFDQWRTNVFDPPLCWDLAHVELFDEAARHVRPEDVAARVIVSSDPSQHLARLVELVDVGFDGVWLHHVGQQQRGFIDVFGEHVVPELRRAR
jgi:alkanesulfonate monooxygenase SsuD/methylene tetrahydromethanopterin reductase-like flavin-dependent oxidoreductase (luciferase family)